MAELVTICSLPAGVKEEVTDENKAEEKSYVLQPVKTEEPGHAHCEQC